MEDEVTSGGRLFSKWSCFDYIVQGGLLVTFTFTYSRTDKARLSLFARCGK